jgi:hypothetical protein
MNLDDLALGWREALIGAILLLVAYIFFVAGRLRRIKPAEEAAPPPSIDPAATAAKPEDEAGDNSPPPETAPPQAVQATSVPDFPWNEPPEPPGVDERIAAAFSQQNMLRLEISALKADLALMREEISAYRRIVDQQMERLQAAQHVAPIYGDAMQLAMAGHDAASIAERCGVARAEAELVVALIRNRDGTAEPAIRE